MQASREYFCGSIRSRSNDKVDFGQGTGRETSSIVCGGCEKTALILVDRFLLA